MTKPSRKSQEKCCNNGNFGEDHVCQKQPAPAVGEGKCEHAFVSDQGLQPACTKCGKVKDLAVCPFCGEIPDFESDVQEVGSQYAVECPGCNAQGPIAEYPDTACDMWDFRVAAEATAEADKRWEELRGFALEIVKGYADNEAGRALASDANSILAKMSELSKKGVKP